MVTALPNGALNPNLDRGEPGVMSRPGFPRTQYNMQYTSGGPRVNAGDLPQPPPSKYLRSTSYISVVNYHPPPDNAGSSSQISVLNYNPYLVNTGSTTHISGGTITHPKTCWIHLTDFWWNYQPLPDNAGSTSQITVVNYHPPQDMLDPPHSLHRFMFFKLVDHPVSILNFT